LPHVFKRAAVAAAVTAALVTVPSVRATAAMPSTIAITGYGYGHGRGMGQYGAYGYAASGWTYRQILGLYYGGTTLTTSPASPGVPATINAHLVELDGAASVAVQAASGTLYVNGINTNKPAATLQPGQSAYASGGADVIVSGPWSNGTTRYFPGSISLVAASPYNEVLDNVTLDQYVEGVVPAEMPASWPAEALKAQAVAARSYALAYEQRNGYNSICDYAACQMYVGDPAQDPAIGSYAKDSDAAVAATSGQVLACNSSGQCGNPGQVAFTEFSASTGGYTSGGDFPAVADAGDGEVPSGNPFHPWTATVSSSTIESDWPSLGTLESIQVTQRNGLGTWGGRVESMNLIGSNSTVTISGDTFAGALGLYSDWFNISGATPPAGSDTGYWIAGSDGSVFNYGTAPSYGSLPSQDHAAPVVGLAPTPGDSGYWLATSAGGVFSYGAASFYGSAGNLVLASPIVAIASTPSSGGYWLASAAGGVFSYGGAVFYGAASTYHPASPIVAIVATADGKGYWELTRGGGVLTFGDAHFYGSPAQYGGTVPVVGMQRTPTGNGYWVYKANGGVFAFGSAGFGGSLASSGQNNFIGAAATPDQGGYVMVTASGVAETAGDATWLGDPADSAPSWNGQAVGIYPA
jgi:peptidoglycan hydrolase-like amidase